MYNYHQRRPVPIYASARTVSQVKRTFWYVFQESTDASSRPALTLTTVDGPFDLYGLTVRPFDVLHGEPIITGFRIGRFAYITDGKSIPRESLALLSGLDLLVINTLRRAPHPTHFTLEETLEAIRLIAPRRALLTHISHDLEHESLSRELPAGIQPAHDGLTVEVDHGDPVAGSTGASRT
jgi:phosphoribosyl 1,2-cyclic phosphate phosphodiesterase